MRRSRLLSNLVMGLAAIACTDVTTRGISEPTLRGPAAVLAATPAEAVLPSWYADVMGETNNKFPQGAGSLRYQQVFSGSDVTNPLIVGVCLRRDDVKSGDAVTQTLTVKLGPTTRDYTTLGYSFDANYSASPTEVFSGEVALPAAALGGTPTDFDFCIPFTQSYVHPSGSNLIIEFLNTSSTSGNAVRDACDGSLAVCTTSRAFAFTPTAETAVLVARGGLVMKFVSPEPPLPVDPATIGECMKGGWADFAFRNQGQCVRFVETGEDSRA